MAMVAPLVVSIIALNKSNQAIREKRRPKLDVTAVVVDKTKLKVYAGTHSDMLSDKVNPVSSLDKKVYNELTDESNFGANKIFSYNEEKHLLINLIPKDATKEDIEKYVVIGFSALEVELEYEKNTIGSIELANGYTLISRKEAIPPETRLGVNFLLNKEESSNGKLIIPVIYLSLKDNHKAKLLDRVLLETNTENQRVDMLTVKNPLMWLGFEETGYLLRVSTISNDTFDYSFIMTVDPNKFYMHPIFYEDKFFRKRANEAAKGTGKKNIIQE